jgi:hypothetical protein
LGNSMPSMQNNIVEVLWRTLKTKNCQSLRWRIAQNKIQSSAFVDGIAIKTRFAIDIVEGVHKQWKINMYFTCKHAKVLRKVFKNERTAFNRILRPYSLSKYIISSSWSGYV